MILEVTAVVSQIISIMFLLLQNHCYQLYIHYDMTPQYSFFTTMQRVKDMQTKLTYRYCGHGVFADCGSNRRYLGVTAAANVVNSAVTDIRC
jgi:hypothetical protein